MTELTHAEAEAEAKALRIAISRTTRSGNALRAGYVTEFWWVPQNPDFFLPAEFLFGYGVLDVRFAAIVSLTIGVRG